LPPLNDDDARLANKSFNALNYYFEGYNIRGTRVSILEKQVVMFGELVEKKDEKIAILEAKVTDEKKCCEDNKNEVAKLEKKVKRKAFFGNTKLLVGIGIGVAGTVLIMK